MPNLTEMERRNYEQRLARLEDIALRLSGELFMEGPDPHASVLHGWVGWRKGRPVSMLRISPSCRTNTMLTVATTLRGRSDA